MLDDNAQNFAEEAVLTLEAIDTDATTVERTFIMHGQIPSVGGALPAHAYRVGFDIDDGSGYICISNETPLEFILWKPENGAQARPCIYVHRASIAPDVTTVKVALKVWMPSGDSGSITDTRWLVQQTGVKIE